MSSPETTKTGYGMAKRLAVPYETAVDRATAALKAEGFGVLTEIDVQTTLKKKLDADFRKYIILGACNPALAHRALQTELEIGLLLPCNVIVYEDDADHSIVSIVDPLAMLGIGDNAGLEPIAQEAGTRLERVLASLEG